MTLYRGLWQAESALAEIAPMPRGGYFAMPHGPVHRRERNQSRQSRRAITKQLYKLIHKLK